MKNETFEPLIHTIPDDTMIFAALHTNDCVCKKIITENYINFYARRHQFVRDVIVRFENLIDYESIRGLKRIFIPSDFMMQFASNPKNILDLLMMATILICRLQSLLFLFIIREIRRITI